MKNILCFLAALVLLSFAGGLPFPIHDASELNPVQTLQIEVKDHCFTLNGDNEQMGTGKTFSQAIEDLKRTSSGIAFLQTAQHILLTGDTKMAIDALLETTELRPACTLYLASEAMDDLAQVNAYLETKHTGVTLADYRSAILEGRPIQLPHIEKEGERVELYA